MGYPEREKLPLIEAAPSNEDIFEDIFQEAARRLGVRLDDLKSRRLNSLDEVGVKLLGDCPANRGPAYLAFTRKWSK
jgi:hypothetical protein